MELPKNKVSKFNRMNMLTKSKRINIRVMVKAAGPIVEWMEVWARAGLRMCKFTPRLGRHMISPCLRRVKPFSKLKRTSI